MCLIAFAWNTHPRYKFIFASNRDEFYKRQTRSADFWEENSQLLAGKDLEAGGTWLGLTKTGKFTALTNYRDPLNIRKNTPSRGELTTDFLTGSDDAQVYLERIAAKAEAYNGFNLLTADLIKGDLEYFSNYENKIRPLSSGVYGLSNHLLDTEWYKVKNLKENFQQVIHQNDFTEEDLFGILNNPLRASEKEVQQTGLSVEMETMLSAIFIQSPEYGTCASSVILLDYEGNISFSEKVYNTPDKNPVQKTFRFKIES